MATTRNHQLKVYNTFNGGVQNVPADHLIQENAFTFGHNDNTLDGTLRPAREAKPLATLAPDTSQVIKENVKGADTQLPFKDNIEYINYADTVYYVKASGSPLLQINPKSPNKQEIALPTYSGDVLTESSSSDLKQAFIAPRTEISTAYTKLVTNTVQAVAQQEVVSNKGNYNPLLSRLEEAVHSWRVVSEDEVTFDNYRTLIEEDKTSLAHTRDRLALLVVETDGSLATRIKSAVSDPRFGICSWINSNDYDNAPAENGGREALGAMGALDVGGKSQKIVDSPLGSLFDVVVDYDPKHEKYAEPFIVQYAPRLILISQAVVDSSVFRYLAVTVNNYAMGKYRRASYTSVHDTAESAVVTLGRIRDLYIAEGEQKIFTGDTADRGHLIGLLRRVVTTDEEVIRLVLFMKFITGLRRWADKGFDTKGNVYKDISFQQASANFSTINTELKEVLKVVDAIDIGKDIESNIAEYAVVGINSDIGAPTNMLRSKPTYDKDKVIITFPRSGAEIDKYYIYRKQANQDTFLKVGEVTDNANSITLTAPYERGAVPTDPYRVEVPDQHFSNIVEKEGVIFLNRQGSQEIWFTYPNSPHSMDSLSNIKMPQPVVAMQSAGAGVFVWTNNNTLYLLKGTSRDSKGSNTLTIKLIAENVEALADRSVCSIDNLVMWLSPYGIHNTSGYGSAESTKTFWDGTYIKRSKQSLVSRGVAYWLVETKDHREELLSYDSRTKRVSSQDATGIVSISEVDGELVGVTAGASPELVAFGKGANPELVAFGKGDKLMTYNVGLKRYAGYSFDTRMNFTNVTIYHTAQPYPDIPYDSSLRTTVKIFIDDYPVGEETLLGSTATRVDLPNTNNKGYSIRCEFQGSLGIKSARIRYTTLDWED